MLTEMHYLFYLIVSQPDVDICMFTKYNKTHYMAHLLLTLPSHSYANLWRHNSTIS